MWTRIILLSIFGFTFSVTSSLDLRGIVNGDRMAGIPLGRSLGSGEVDFEGICTKPGMACQNCKTAVTCVRLPVGWLKVPLEDCAEGSTCNAHQGKCSKKHVPECDAESTYSHSCEQVGIFPDAVDCKKFHFCLPPEGVPDSKPVDHRSGICPRHYGYNPQTAQCSVILENGQCKEKVIPDCTKLGAFGVLPTSDNHYYVCLRKDKKLRPQIFICPNGWNFWDDGFCRPDPRPLKREPISSESNSNEKSSEKEVNSEKSTISTSTKSTITTTKLPTEAPTTTNTDVFFSTEKATTYAADTFLADKFDLSNYETTDDVQPNFVNSFENNDWDF